jgi:hypothetical protein
LELLADDDGGNEGNDWDDDFAVTLGLQNYALAG